MSDEVIQSGSGNVFADLGFADGANHKLKAELVRKIAGVISDRGLTQTAAGKLMGIHQSDLSRLLSGRFRDMSVERLLRMLTRLDCDVEITVHYEGHDVGEPIHLEAVAA